VLYTGLGDVLRTTNMPLVAFYCSEICFDITALSYRPAAPHSTAEATADISNKQDPTDIRHNKVATADW